jgi:hypothetical protein
VDTGEPCEQGDEMRAEAQVVQVVGHLDGDLGPPAAGMHVARVADDALMLVERHDADMRRPVRGRRPVGLGAEVAAGREEAHPPRGERKPIEELLDQRLVGRPHRADHHRPTVPQ